MSVNSYLENLGSNLILSSNEKENIQKSINHLRECLNNYFGREITDQFIFGSYKRNTILPRMYDNKSDIDYMISKYQNEILFKEKPKEKIKEKKETFDYILCDFETILFSSTTHSSSGSNIVIFAIFPISILPAPFLSKL